MPSEDKHTTIRVLILSFYYEPDLSAGSFRCTSLVKQLAKHDVKLEIVTTMPNRYNSYRVEAPTLEQKGKVTVRRVVIPPHQSGMVSQIRAFAAFYRRAHKLVAKSDYDVVFATSSRLFTAFLGARIAKKKQLPLYLDIRDILVEAMNNILSSKLTWLIVPLLSIIENYTFSSAKKINLVSEGFLDYFRERYKQFSFSFFTNGIDQEFINLPLVSHEAKFIITVLYAGNIGEGQGLHKIIPELATRLNDRVQFKIIGDGGMRKELEHSLINQGIDNVELLPPMDRQSLIAEYLQADVLFLHLNDYPAYERVLPSKLFEYAALPKPIWAGLKGYSSYFAQSEISDCAVFSPVNYLDAIEKFETLNFDPKPRTQFVEKFSREAIMSGLATDILESVKYCD